MKKILFGICGIGNGHFFRQKVIIDYLLSIDTKILFFSYADGLLNLQQYAHFPNVKIIEVSVPYLTGDIHGLNFIKSLSSEKNININFQTNLKALAFAQEWLGKPDLVISDYEPISAQYSYAYDSQLLTYDQQSKFFNQEINIPGYSCKDEIMRLNMFFPKATRIASSFFKIKSSKKVSIVPPSYRTSIRNLQRKIIENTFLIYFSPQSDFNNISYSIINTLSQRNEKFYIFHQSLNINSSQNNKLQQYLIQNNIKNIFLSNQFEFENHLSFCQGVICNSGHNLISECMFLNIPVYCIPLDLYEQKLNSFVISSNKFGIESNSINNSDLSFFIHNLSLFNSNIKNDKKILFKNDGKLILIKKIKKLLSFD